MIILPHLIYLHTVNVSGILPLSKHLLTLIPQILPPRLYTTSDPLVDEEALLSLWQATHDNPPSSHISSHRQCVWDSAIVEASFNALVVSSPDTQSRARLLAVSCPKSGAWLHAMLIYSVGLQMDDDVVRVAVSLRFGIPMCHPYVCSCCGAEVNNLGTHGLSCRFNKGRHSRHAALNDIIKHALDSARIPCHLESSGLYTSDGKRPDDASVVPWRCGKILVWDATCVDILAPSHQALAAREPLAIAVDDESKKYSKYAHLESTHHFVPVAVETLGAIGPEASSLLKEIARRISLACGEERAHVFLLQRVAVAVQRENAASVLGSM